MKTDNFEYLPPQFEQHQKAFEIRQAKNPETEKILKTRMDALTDPDLHDGARVLFTLLLDLSLDPSVNSNRRFQIAISNRQLQERLDRSARAIYGWVNELQEGAYLWVSKLGRPNTKPLNVYHIEAFQPRRGSRVELAGDGLWGNGYRRADSPMPKGARAGFGTKRHYLVDHLGRPLLAQVVANEPATRKICGSLPQVMREPAAQNDTCHPQNLRGTAAQNDTCHPQNLRMPSAQNDTCPPHKTAVLIESQDKRTEIDQGGRAALPHPQKHFQEVVKGEIATEEAELAVWRRSLNGYFPSRLEKLLNRLITQRDNATAANVRQFIGRKIRIIREIQDGPLPEAHTNEVQTEPAMPAAKPSSPATAEEILEGARYLVTVGKGHLLTQAQKAALASAS